MMQTFFWCYPWDLVDEGVEVSLGRMAGEIGLDAVSVATTYHDVNAFRARAYGDRRTVRHEAAAHFQPDRQRYASTRIRPVTAAWMKSRNPLEKIAREAEKQGLKLRAWTVCCHHPALVARYPIASCVDVFGEAIPSRLCPSCPDVREYLVALVEDLTTNYPVEALELQAADFGFGACDHPAPTTAVSPRPADRALLSWCFCSSCRQRAADAGIDVKAVVAAATDRLERAMRLAPAAPTSFEAMLAENEHLFSYHRMRTETVTSLVRMMRERSQGPLKVHATAGPGFTGVDPSALAGVCDGFVLSYVRGHVNPSDEAFLHAAGEAGRIDLKQSCFPPHTEDGPSLVTEVRAARANGYGGLGFYNYGLVPEPCLDWVRQAVRYARRESAT